MDGKRGFRGEWTLDVGSGPAVQNVKVCFVCQ